MNVAIRRRSDFLVAGLLIAVASLTLPFKSVQAYPEPGTTPLDPGQTVVPALIPNGTAAGTFVTWSTTSNFDTLNFLLSEAVYREPAGTLDFYYQITSFSTAHTLANFVSSSWAGYAASAGYRLDGSTIASGPPTGYFFNGTYLPTSASRTGDGSTVGFNFVPPIISAGGAAASSVVFIVSTNATSYTNNGSGHITGSVIGGGAFDIGIMLTFVPSGPALAVATPEAGGSIWLLSFALFGLFAFRAVAGKEMGSAP